MRVLITGVAGFLGSHLADYLIAAGHEVVGIDDLSTGVQSNVPRDVKFIPMDISAHDRISIHMHRLQSACRGCDVVFHCAAAAYEGVSIFSPGFISRNIYAGSANVFSAAAASGVRRIVNCSSMARYGNAQNPPFEESGSCDPVDPYGLAKLTAECLLRQLAQVHGFEYAIAVPHSIYGPRQRFDDPYRNVAAIMTNRMLRGLPPVIYGDGSQVRCFSHVDDVVPILAAMGWESQVNGETINLGPDRGDITILSLAQLLAQIINWRGEFEFQPGRPCEVQHATCSADKARSLLGYEAKIPLETGLKSLVDYVREAGPRPFRYHLDVEIVNDKTPRTWLDRLI